MKAKLFYCGLAALSLNSFIVSAYAVGANTKDTTSIYIARAIPDIRVNDLEFAHVELDGFTGDYTGGSLYSMIKLLGNNKQIFYGSFYGNYQDTTHNNIMGLGIGYRNTLKVNDLLGAYVYLDRNDLRDSDFLKETTFFVLNPGVEWLGKDWDLHINGYFPTSHKHWEIRDGWADQIGEFKYVRIQGHTLYDQHMTEYANVGNGFDVSVGAVIPEMPRAKAYVGSYYFNQNDGAKINGIFGKLNFALTSYTALTITDTYDNQKHNTFTAGLKIIFGKNKTVDYASSDISERLLDTPQRNLIAQNYGTSVPITKSSKAYALSDSGFDKELDNIYAFVPNNNAAASDSLQADAKADGTFEHPYSYSDFTQSTINQIGTNANIFFGGAGTAAMRNVTIFNGQSLYGRSSDFIMSARGDGRPTLEGSLNLLGNNLIDSVSIKNMNGIYQVGINFVSPKATAALHNVDIGTKDNLSGSYNTGINVSDVSLLDIRDSNIYAANASHKSTVYGLNIQNSTVNIKNSTVYSDNISAFNMADVLSYGISAVNSWFNVSGSSITSFSSNSNQINNAISAASYGIYIKNSQAEITNTSINSSSSVIATAKSSSAVGNAYGVFINSDTAVISDVVMKDDNIAANSCANGEGAGQSSSYGAYADNAELSFAASVINSSSYSNSSSTGYGIYAVNGAYVAINSENNIRGSGFLTNSGAMAGNGYGVYTAGSNIDISSSTIAGIGSSNAYGIYAASGNTINLLDSSSLFAAHNLSNPISSDAIGIYSSGDGNYFTNTNYKFSRYDVSGGSNTHNWYPESLLQIFKDQNRK